MSKEEINLMREAMHKGVKMLIEEMEKGDGEIRPGE